MFARGESVWSSNLSAVHIGIPVYAHRAGKASKGQALGLATEIYEYKHGANPLFPTGQGTVITIRGSGRRLRL